MKIYLQGSFHSALFAVLATLQLISVSVVASDVLNSAKQSNANIADFDGKTVQFDRSLNPNVEKFFDSNPYIENVEIRTLDTTKIRFSKKMFRLRLLSGDKVLFTKAQIETTNSGGLLWMGLAKNGGKLTIVLNEDNLHGVIDYGGKIFHITKMDEKYYAVYEVSPNALPRTNDEPKSEMVRCSTSDCVDYGQNAMSTSTQSSSTHSNIRILAVYTTDARDKLSGDANSAARLVVMANDVSQAFANNAIDGSVSIDLVATNYINYQESSNGHLQIIHDVQSDPTVIAMRDYYGADVVAIMVAAEGYCGLVESIGANTNNAFFTIKTDCTDYTFPHELGHLLGARHNPEDDSTGTFNHGYLDTTNEFKTIMSLNFDQNCCTRIGYFSTPGQFHNGDVIGTASTHDNKRQVLDYAPTASSFKSKTTASVDMPSLSVRPEYCYGYNNATWTEEYGDPSVSYKLYRSSSSSMSSKLLVYNGTARFYTVNLVSANDMPYFAVEACDSLGCSTLSQSKKAKYINSCY